MGKLIDVFALLMIIALSPCISYSACAQIMKPDKMLSMEELVKQGKIPQSYYIDKWWWGLTPFQVRSRIVMERGWEVEDIASSNPYQNRLSAKAENGSVMLLFSFTKEDNEPPNYLVERIYSFSENHQMVREWETDLAELPFDSRNSRWLDEKGGAQIKRVYTSGRVAYYVKMYSEEIEKADGTK